MKNIDFILNKLRYLTNAKTDKELCEILNINYSTLDTWKNNDNIPKKRLLEFSQKLNIPLENLNSTIINQGNNSRAAGRDYIKNSNDKKQEDMFDDITIGLIKKAIEKFGSEEEFQFQFMNFLRDK